MPDAKLGLAWQMYALLDFSDPALKHATASHDHPTVLYDLNVMR